jgi:hypothetical protein
VKGGDKIQKRTGNQPENLMIDSLINGRVKRQ